jgi:alkanesulfonate monooxygenase SsuD/methylene tetrahydromethanopterin reductase-like flavin-dependent oxidoreductase (luciferase family)
MKYGVFHLFDYHPDLHGSEVDAYRQMLAQSVEAEPLGYDAVWCAEHHFTRYAGLFPSPVILGTAVARETQRLRLGLAVSLLPYHRPVRIADDTAMLDILSEGRLEFGAGRGGEASPPAAHPATATDARRGDKRGAALHHRGSRALCRHPGGDPPAARFHAGRRPVQLRGDAARGRVALDAPVP